MKQIRETIPSEKKLYAIITMWLSLIATASLSIESVNAEVVSDNEIISQNSKSLKQLLKNQSQHSLQPISLRAKDLLVQRENRGLTRVTGVQAKQTAEGLELILETSSRQKLVPLILPEGKNLIIDILDATLGFSLRNGFREVNPAPGIREIRVTKVNENSIQIKITGAKKAPVAEVVPSPNNLVLSVTPERATAEQTPEEEIEIIATGEGQAEDDYYVPDAGVTRTDAPIIDTPSAVQVVPQQLIEDQGATDFSDALRGAAGVT
ncbi:MAG: AMIN domain-containing protein, partial [Waterburya sp.]